MGYVIDCRKNWALAEKRLQRESDPRRKRNLETIIAHSKAEAVPDFNALMATVAENAKYTSYTDGGGEEHSPVGKDGVATYYRMIVSSGQNNIEHAVERMAIGDDTVTTEGEMKIAFPGKVLTRMGITVPDEAGFYLYETRLLVVWGFDENGLVTCEDSYDGGGLKFEGIAKRPVTIEQIYDYQG